MLHPENQLLALRQVLGLRQSAVAKALGIAPDTLGRYESRARRITPQVQRRLASVFGIEPSSLFSTLKDQWGQPYSRLSWEGWKLLSPEQREQIIDIEVLLMHEVRRLFHTARNQGKASDWVPKQLRLLREMSEDLKERPPIPIFVFDRPAVFTPNEASSEPNETGSSFRLGTMKLDQDE